MPTRSKSNSQISSSSKEKSSEDNSIFKSRSQRRAAARAQEKLDLIFDFSEITESSPNDLEFLSVSVPANEVIQRDLLNEPVPYSENSLKVAVKRMTHRVDA